jgi:transposase
VWLSQEQQDDFERFARSRTLAARWVQRSQILLMAAAHQPDREIAHALGITRQTVALWQERFVEPGIAGVEKEAPRSGRPRTILAPQIDEILRRTTRETPPTATPWSTRTLAQVSQVSFSTVGRIWRAHGLKPHRVKTCKLSNIPALPRSWKRW